MNINLENQPLVGGVSPLDFEKPKVPDLVPDVNKIVETAQTKNWLAFVEVVAENCISKLKKETNTTGVSFFPFIEEKQMRDDAYNLAQEIFSIYKEEGYLDEFNRFSEKFYSLRSAQNAS